MNLKYCYKIIAKYYKYVILCISFEKTDFALNNSYMNLKYCCKNVFKYMYL